MGRYIGIDLGTTSVTALVLDTGSGAVIARASAENRTETTSPADQARGRSEWDIDRMIHGVVDLLGTVASSASGVIDGIGVTGQQHGMVLLDEQERPLTPFIGWQDRRCLDRTPEGRTFLDFMAALGGSGFERSEYRPARGYMGSTLFWLIRHGFLPKRGHAAFAPDYLVSRLCGQRPVTDPTNAAGAGVYDVISRQWHPDLLLALNIPGEVLPVVQPSCAWIGKLTADMARAAGLPSGTPVANACGDNQASFAGSVAGYADSVLVNIGTGGQVSVFHHEPVRIEGLLVRPYLQPGFLLVGAGLTGGRAYGVLERFMQLVGAQIFGVTETPDIFDRLNELAAAVASGSDGLHCEPVFTGSLQDPRRRGQWTGVSDTNLTPGHLTRSLLEGMAEQFSLMYEAIQTHGVPARTRLIGAGNGARRNPLLCAILSEAFRLPLNVVRHTEEAAFGAALTASVAAGEFADIEAAGRASIKYKDEG